MREFSVLSTDLDLRESYFLEASAGTGKTFAIEHLVTRLCLSGITIDRILVVTFTRAATRELKLRIRSNLQAAMESLQTGAGLPYLRQHEADTAFARLDEAYFEFEEARILTIHSFCFEMLRELAFEGGMCLELSRGQESLSGEEQLGIVQDAFRLHSDLFSPGQLDRLLASAGGDFDRLMRRLLQTQPRPGGTFEEELQTFKQAMKSLALSGRECREAFHRLAPSFTGLCDRSGTIKVEYVQQNERLAAMLDQSCWSADDFDFLIQNGAVMLDLIANGTLKKGRAVADLEVPHRLQQHLEPILNGARDVAVLEQRMAARVHDLLSRHMKRKERLTHDGLLQKMLSACGQERFCQAVRGRFDAVIVDEFQDTDPIQWTIFHRLFVGHMPTIFVGDPKQSIYSFRQADIYSYLAARDALGEARRWSLATNYRSRPRLVERLNQLFSSVSDWITLPRLGIHLPYEPVRAGVGDDGPLGNDDPLQFAVVEDADYRGNPSSSAEYNLFAFIANEICLVFSQGTKLRSIAVLVTDRYQAQRIHQFLARHHIPSQLVRGMPFSQSPMVGRLREAVEAALDFGKAKPILLSLFGWTLDRLATADQTGETEHLETLTKLRHHLFEAGLSAFTEGLLGIPAVRDSLLAAGDGERNMHDLQQIAAFLADCPVRQLVSRLTDLELREEVSGENTPLRPLSDDDAVTIQTVFGSKGLEYDVVFALAVAWRTRDSAREIQEVEAEKGRILYVALTRARERVYVPVVIDLKGVPAPPGSAAPIDRLLGPKPLEALKGFTVRRLDGNQEVNRLAIRPVELLKPTPCTVVLPERRLQSFTRLARSHATLSPVIVGEGELPVGAQTGVILHSLLERVPLRHYSSADELLPLVQNTLLAGYERQLAQLLWNGLSAPLDGFCMMDVSPRCVLREAEFLYEVQDHLLEGREVKAGSITGIVDAIVYHRDRYYLIDWKTHCLPDYGPAQLQRVIHDNDYRLQASLYETALQRYLALTDNRPFSEIFGGTYYVFIRKGVSVVV